MAKQKPIAARELMAVADEDDSTPPPAKGRGKVQSTVSELRQKRDTRQRAEVLSLLLAGLTYDQIAERQGVSRTAVAVMIGRALEAQEATGIETLRAIENARLDRAQAAIWTRVLDGDNKAIDTFLRISGRRARLNGMDAPFQIELSAHVRVEMEQALSELQDIVLGEVVRDGRLSEDGSSALE